MPKELIGLVLAIVIVGAIVWGLMKLPIDDMFKTVARVILIVVLVIWAAIVIAGMLGVSVPLK